MRCFANAACLFVATLADDESLSLLQAHAAVFTDEEGDVVGSLLTDVQENEDFVKQFQFHDEMPEDLGDGEPTPLNNSKQANKPTKYFNKANKKAPKKKTDKSNKVYESFQNKAQISAGEPVGQTTKDLLDNPLETVLSSLQKQGGNVSKADRFWRRRRRFRRRRFRRRTPQPTPVPTPSPTPLPTSVEDLARSDAEFRASEWRHVRDGRGNVPTICGYGYSWQCNGCFYFKTAQRHNYGTGKMETYTTSSGCNKDGTYQKCVGQGFVWCGPPACARNAFDANQKDYSKRHGSTCYGCLANDGSCINGGSNQNSCIRKGLDWCGEQSPPPLGIMGILNSGPLDGSFDDPIYQAFKSAKQHAYSWKKRVPQQCSQNQCYGGCWNFNTYKLLSVSAPTCLKFGDRNKSTCEAQGDLWCGPSPCEVSAIYSGNTAPPCLGCLIPGTKKCNNANYTYAVHPFVYERCEKDCQSSYGVNEDGRNMVVPMPSHTAQKQQCEDNGYAWCGGFWNTLDAVRRKFSASAHNGIGRGR